MKNLSISRRITICATFTAEQWQLYEPQAEATRDVAMVLNGALMLAVHKLATRAEVEAQMIDILHLYAEFGACDYDARHFLRQVLNQIYGED